MNASPYVATAFLCAKHALTKGASMFFDIYLALIFTKDQNLRRKWSGLTSSRNIQNGQKKKQKKRKDPTSISLRASEVKLVSVRPQPSRDPIKQGKV